MFKAYGKAISNYFNFSGRARRKEIWGFCLTNVLIAIVIGVVAGLTGTPMYAENGNAYMALPGWFIPVTLLYTLFTIIPTLSLYVRRLHDSGKSGLYLLWSFFPLVGYLIVLIPLFFKKGDAGDNQYGADPKAEIANV